MSTLRDLLCFKRMTGSRMTGSRSRGVQAILSLLLLLTLVAMTLHIIGPEVTQAPGKKASTSRAHHVTAVLEANNGTHAGVRTLPKDVVMRPAEGISRPHTDTNARTAYSQTSVTVSSTKRSTNHKPKQKPYCRENPNDTGMGVPTNNTLTYFLSPPDQLCSGSPEFIILILSSPGNLAARRAIRETWGGALRIQNHGNNSAGVPHPTMSLGFLLGKKMHLEKNSQEMLQNQIVEEHRTYGDIIQGDYDDTWKNITYKSVLAYKFATEFCTSSRFMVKMDDDVFLNPYRLAEYAPYTRGNVIVGDILPQTWRKTDRNNKYSVTCEQYSKTDYPEYAFGPVYIVTMDVVPKLFHLAMSTTFYPIDDVFMTGFLRVHLGIDMSGKITGALLRDGRASGLCDLKRYFAYHKVNPPRQYLMWTYLQDKLTNATAKCPYTLSDRYAHLIKLNLTRSERKVQSYYRKQKHFKLRFKKGSLKLGKS